MKRRVPLRLNQTRTRGPLVNQILKLVSGKVHMSSDMARRIRAIKAHKCLSKVPQRILLQPIGFQFAHRRTNAPLGVAVVAPLTSNCHGLEGMFGGCRDFHLQGAKQRFAVFAFEFRTLGAHLLWVLSSGLPWRVQNCRRCDR